MKAARTTNRTNTSHIVRQIVESEDSDISVTDYVRTAFSDNFGHSNCVILRDWCKLNDLHLPRNAQASACLR